MRKIFRLEQENNFDWQQDFETLEEARNDLNKILHDEANHNYFANSKNVYTIYEVNINDNKDYEDEYIKTIISLSVKEYDEMSFDEKKEKGLNY